MAWLLIQASGEVQTVHMDKRQLIQVMGLEIPMRDLRLMDPALAAYDSFAQILVRDNALVVSAEHVRLIITCDRVICPLDFEKTEASQRFTKTLEAVIRERPDVGAGGGLLHSHGSHAFRLHRQSSAGGPYHYLRDPDLLPFELNMLEVALGEITRHYAQQTSSLEALAHPALDALMSKCNSTNLERVRKIKTGHQRLLGRLTSLREVLERYTEDDQDMYRMCLSKAREQDLEGADAGSDNTLLLGRRELYGTLGLDSTVPVAGSLRQAGSLRHRGMGSLVRSPPHAFDRFQGLHRSSRGDGGGGGSSSGSSSSSSSSGGADQHDLLEVENLLESYLMMVDGVAAKLAAIGEYIDDTEDYINIELDYNRNRLLRIEILLTVATFSLAVYNLVAGILGENLVLPATWTADLRGFIVINATTASVCAATFFVIWKIMVRRKLI